MRFLSLTYAVVGPLFLLLHHIFPTGYILVEVRMNFESLNTFLML